MQCICIIICIIYVYIYVYVYYVDIPVYTYSIYVTSNSEDINVYVSLCVHTVSMLILFTLHSCIYMINCTPIFYLAPADVHGNIQLVSLHKVPVDVLPRLLRWFSQAKHLVCHDIHPPQEVQRVHMSR